MLLREVIVERQKCGIGRRHLPDSRFTDIAPPDAGGLVGRDRESLLTMRKTRSTVIRPERVSAIW
jgi:hypothetical protein